MTEAVGERREVLLAGAVDYVLAHGVASLSLRPLASALGTSDRMLVYYFGTRDALVAAVLARAEVVDEHPVAPAALPALALAALGAPGAEALLRLWLEVAGLAAQGDPICRATSGRVLEGWLGFLGERLDVPAEERRAAAAAVLAVLDGLVLQRLVGGEADAAAAAAWLAGPGLTPRPGAG